MSPADVSSRTDIFSVVVAKRAPKVEARVTRSDLSTAPIGLLGPQPPRLPEFPTGWASSHGEQARLLCSYCLTDAISI